MTLRQLRQVASDLGVSLYSRKTKEELVNAISTRQPLASSSGGAETAADQAWTDPRLSSLEADLAPAPRPESETRVVFLPRDPQWAYVFWEISDGDRQQAQQAGASQLCLRVADVTGLSGGGSHPHTLQEVAVNSHATEWYLAVPLSDRDYRVELGYRKGGGGWISLATSAVARVPALHPSEQIYDQFVPFSLDTTPLQPGQAPQAGTNTSTDSPSDNSLHERLYQAATLPASRWRHLARGSEAFHEDELAGSAAQAAARNVTADFTAENPTGRQRRPRRRPRWRSWRGSRRQFVAAGGAGAGNGAEHHHRRLERCRGRRRSHERWRAALACK